MQKGNSGPNEGSGLNDGQELFCHEYIKDQNATQAAIRAGYSEKTAYSQGQRLLKKVEAAALIAELTKEKCNTVKVDAAWVLIEAVDLYKECRIEGDRASANKSLDTIGKHVEVKAWDKSVTIEAGESLELILEEARKRAGAAD